MRENISRFLRSTVGATVLILIFGFALLIHIWAITANYNATVQSFELLGYDQKPISDDPLFGWFFEALLLGDATQSHLYAGFVVLMLAMGFGISVYYIFKLIMLLRDRKVYQTKGDTESASQAEILIIYDTLPYLVISLTLVGILAWWDLYLFNYRSLAGTNGVESQEDAVLLKKLGLSIAESPDSFALALNAIGGWGYLAATLLSAFFLKFAWILTKERFIAFEDAVLGLFSFVENNMVAGDMQTAASTTPAESAERNNNQGRNNSTADITTSTASSDQERIIEATSPQADAEEMVEVIGEEKPVRLSEILANKDRYYKHEDGRYWVRELYENLHGASTLESTPAAA